MVNYWIFGVGGEEKDVKEYIGVRRKSSSDDYGERAKGKNEVFNPATPNVNKLCAGDKILFYNVLKGNFIGTAKLTNESIVDLQRMKTFTHHYQWSPWMELKLDEVTFYKVPRSPALLISSTSMRMVDRLCRPGVVKQITQEDFDVVEDGYNLRLLLRKDDGHFRDKPQFYVEKYLHEYLADNFETIDFGNGINLGKKTEEELMLKLFIDADKNSGIQYYTDAGYIDFIGVDEDGDYHVIVLKQGRESGYVVSKLLQDMGYVKRNLAKSKVVKGILLSTEEDKQMEMMLLNQENISIIRCNVEFEVG